ncbi:hypothetical protein AgCh_014082 [Apium graveolens]
MARLQQTQRKRVGSVPRLPVDVVAAIAAEIFWAEAAMWTVYVLNRSPTLVVKDKTPEEVWTGFKPDVADFRVFGCFAHVHIPDQKRIKLDDKSIKCMLLGINKESKAYQLYDPVDKRIVVSRDVVFEEDKGCNWGRTNDEEKLDLID